MVEEALAHAKDVLSSPPAPPTPPIVPSLPQAPLPPTPPLPPSMPAFLHPSAAPQLQPPALGAGRATHGPATDRLPEAPPRQSFGAGPASMPLASPPPHAALASAAVPPASDLFRQPPSPVAFHPETAHAPSTPSAVTNEAFPPKPVPMPLPVDTQSPPAAKTAASTAAPGLAYGAGHPSTLPEPAAQASQLLPADSTPPGPQGADPFEASPPLSAAASAAPPETRAAPGPASDTPSTSAFQNVAAISPLDSGSVGPVDTPAPPPHGDYAGLLGLGPEPAEGYSSSIKEKLAQFEAASALSVPAGGKLPEFPAQKPSDGAALRAWAAAHDLDEGECMH